MTTELQRLADALADRYRVQRELGAGGMATVYLAEDIRHGRQVAIKVLHEDLGATLGPERFLAEIRTTARLQHPHILPLLDSGRTAPAGTPGGLLYYVMPYVDGESLRDRLARERQLPIDDAVRIAREVADALALAHEQGVVHRDIKPENILLQGSAGKQHALVADFGIALAVQQAGGARMTQTGLSLGTPQYMAPEQAMGEKTIDARADLYALGAVTYEMLAGEPPFTGATVQAIVAKVLSTDPEPLTTVRRTVPPHIDAAVRTALAKLPADRFAGVAAYSAALAAPGAVGTATERLSGAETRAARPRRAALPFVVGALLGVALGYAAWRTLGASTGDVAVSRTYIRQPATEALPAGTSDFVLSPDGESLVYVGPGEQPGTTQLWRKRRAELHATRIPGTEGAHAPFFSPDGLHVAFFTERALIRQALAGGAPVTIVADVFRAEGRGAWLEDGRILFSQRLALDMVRAEGGPVTTIVPDADFAGYNPINVDALPGGRAVVVQTCPAQCPRAVTYVVDLAAKSARVLLTDARMPTYLPSGQLAWITAAGQLMVSAFDLDALTLTGTPLAVLEQVSAFSVARNGTLVYREGRVGEAITPVWVDRKGNATPFDSSWLAHVSSIALSPDGRRAAVSLVNDGEQHLWLKELPNGPLARFTFGAFNHFRPSWSADGRTLYFVRGDSTFAVAEKSADGRGDVREVPSDGHQLVEVTTSRDGQWLVTRTGGSDTSRTILAQRAGEATPRRIPNAGQGRRIGLALSPDSRFVAYLSAVSGTAEVYVSPFPDMASARWQVSLTGGQEARWSRDGTELYYVAADGMLMSARVSTSPTFAVVSTTPLFDVNAYARDGGFHMYDVEPNGTRFVMLRKQTFPGELVLVEQWLSELKGRLAGRP
ncbi:MAG: serine/threonine-protein kinase [Gemmatimonadetes bacterium]|nr:serine/threonine-protein kinase [Gemmatimonadota bacterium]